MVSLVLLLQLSLVVVITHSQQYGESDVYEETTLTDEDFANAADGSYLESIPEDLKSANHTSIPLDTDGHGHYVESNGSDARRTRRNAYGVRWPDGVVPYAISSSYWPWQRTMIAAAMKEMMDKSCVEFKPKTKDDKNYIFIAPIDGCNSHAGQSVFGGKQDVSLIYACFYHGVILHELMHALGFNHEHQRGDRDNYIKIYKENVLAEYWHAYERILDGETYDIPYDYDSVLHYDSWSGCTCTWAWYKTITRKDNGGDIPSATKLSNKDVKRINIRYECDKDDEW